MAIDDSGSGVELYAKLSDFADHRRTELLAQLYPVKNLTDEYGALVSRAIVAFGKAPPANRHESIMRDLVADVFDFLYEWPRPLFEGRPHVSFPLARRAYESLSLLCALEQDVNLADQWDAGKQISNAQVRKALSVAQFGESENALRELYKTFNVGTHPNRGLIAERYLGDGNDYVLGSIGQPELVIIVDQCTHLVELWFWFGAFVSYAARDPLRAYDASFGQDYMAAAAHAAEIKKWLVESYNRLLSERHKELGLMD